MHPLDLHFVLSPIVRVYSLIQSLTRVKCFINYIAYYYIKKKNGRGRKIKCLLLLLGGQGKSSETQ